MNPIILIAIIAQSFISRANRMAGAILGYVITTGILLWGLSVYRQGSAISLIVFPLSQTAFLVVCLVWYGFDTRAFLRARALSSRSSAQSQSVGPKL